MSVEMDVVYEGDLHCLATHGPSGRTIVTDAPTDNGGRGEAFSPTDLVAAALGACSMTIMGLVAKRSGLDITGAKTRVRKEMASQPARRLGEVTVAVTFPAGRKFSPADRQKLEHAAHACPVHQSLHPDVKVRFEFIYPE
jgi:putative redox protein